MKQEQTFYMVWNPKGRAPTMRHGDFDTAKREAERLCRNTPGDEFYVLQAVSRSQKIDVVTVSLDDPYGVPF